MYKIELDTDTPVASGDKINLDGCTRILFENEGATTAKIGYVGKRRLFSVPPGKSRPLDAPANGEYFGEMDVMFDGNGKGRLLVLKQIASCMETY